MYTSVFCLFFTVAHISKLLLNMNQTYLSDMLVHDRIDITNYLNLSRAEPYLLKHICVLFYYCSE